MYCAALVIVEYCGVEIQPSQKASPTGPPAWKTCLSSNIKHLQGDLNRLHSFKGGSYNEEAPYLSCLNGTI